MKDEFKQENEQQKNNELEKHRADLPHDTLDFEPADRDEEMAAEVTPVVDYSQSTERENNIPTVDPEELGGTALGWTALIVSILALFFFPVVLGTVGAITGFFAYRNGVRTMGIWSIAIGLLAVVMGLFFIPFVGR